jgi:hypothetical protein
MYLIAYLKKKKLPAKTTFLEERWIVVTGRRERRRKQLLDDLKGARGYGKLEAKALYHTLWRTRFGRGCGSIFRQTAK